MAPPPAPPGGRECARARGADFAAPRPRAGKRRCAAHLHHRRVRHQLIGQLGQRRLRHPAFSVAARRCGRKNFFFQLLPSKRILRARRGACGGDATRNRKGTRRGSHREPRVCGGRARARAPPLQGGRHPWRRRRHPLASPRPPSPPPSCPPRPPFKGR